MSLSYFILSPGRSGSILTSYIIKYSLNTLNNREDYCQMQHVSGRYTDSGFITPTTVYHCHDLKFEHTVRKDCDFVLVLRKNILEACLSAYLAQVSGVYTIDSSFHAENREVFDNKLNEIKKTGIDVNIKKWIKLIDVFKSFYQFDIDTLKDCFNNIHTLYYEDFKDNYEYINSSLGIPPVALPANELTEKLPYDKWSVINNKEEITKAFFEHTTQET